MVDRINQGDVDLAINTASTGLIRDPIAPKSEPSGKTGEPGLAIHRRSGYLMRVAALEHHIPCITNILTLRAAVAAIRSHREDTVSIHRLGAPWAQPAKAG